MDLNRLRQLAGINEDDNRPIQKHVMGPLDRPITKDDIEKVFFGSMKGTEKDTEIEKRIFAIIVEFIEGYGHASYAKNDAFQVLKHLQSLKNVYPNDLIPKAKIAYRGTGVKSDYYEELFTMYPDEVPSSKIYEQDYVYHPRSALQSWTTNIQMASDFALGNAVSIGFPEAIIKVPVDDDFILTTKITNMINKKALTRMSGEDEIIRISKQPIKGKLLVYGSWLNNWADEMKEEGYRWDGTKWRFK